MTDLGTYDGIDVATATVSIRNAGDGLSQSLEVDPVALPLHSTVHVVLECEVVKHTYEDIKDAPVLRLVNVLRAGRATIVDAELVEEQLDRQQKAIEEAQGVHQLPLDGDGDDGEFALDPEDRPEAEWDDEAEAASE